MDVPVFVLTSRAEGATLTWGVFPSLQAAKDRAEEVTLDGFDWHADIQGDEALQVCIADFDGGTWRIEEHKLALGTSGADAAILRAAASVLRARFGLITEHERKALNAAADRITEQA